MIYERLVVFYDKNMELMRTSSFFSSVKKLVASAVLLYKTKSLTCLFLEAGHATGTTHLMIFYPKKWHATG